MLIILSIYAAIIWLVFFQFKWLAWNRTAHVFVGLIGLIIALVVVAMLNTKTPSGRVTVMGQVVEIAPLVSGVVETVSIAPNTPVEKGAELFTLDARPYRYALDQAEARAKIAQITYDRKAKLNQGRSATISEQELDEVQAQLDQAKAQLEIAKYDLKQTVVLAPSAGVATALRLAPGEQASAMDPVVPFIKSDGLRLIGVFSQNGSPAIKEGGEIRIAFNGDPGRIYQTTIRAISPGDSSGQILVSGELAGASDVGSSTDLIVIIDWPDEFPDDLRRLGMTGSATVFGPDAGAMGVLAKVLLYLKMLGTYL